jgi:hypothetical protein
MELKEIISIPGKPGLYKVIAQSGKGFIVESLDEKKTRTPISASHSVALLDEITLYTQSDESLTLKEVLENIKKKTEEGTAVTAKDDAGKIRAFFKEVAPNHDEDRVYISDMKKILKWYELLEGAKLIGD